MKEDKDIEKIPNCFGMFVCMDDCMVSCRFWEDCMIEADEKEEEE